MKKELLQEAEAMLFELKHAMVPQDMKTTIAHGNRIDALEFVISQAKQVDVLLTENENNFRNTKSMQYKMNKLEREIEKLQEMASDLDDKAKELHYVKERYLRLLEMVIENGKCSSIDFIIKKITELESEEC